MTLTSLQKQALSSHSKSQLTNLRPLHSRGLFYVMNLLKHPLFQINMILICSLVFIELMHINYHRTAPPCPVEQVENDW